jgi:hypothetical protein
VHRTPEVHPQIIESLPERSHECGRRFVAYRCTDHVGNLPPQPAAYRQKIRHFEKIGDAVQKYLHRWTDGIPIDWRCKDDLIVRQYSLHERLEVIVPVAMLVVIRGHALCAEVDDLEIEL